MQPTQADKAEFQEVLLQWFEREHRDFPWRQDIDPYRILVAEKLLQQSLARQVLIEAYEQILAMYPSPHDLSTARVEDIELIIQPLGFAYRAKELVVMAREIVERHEGKVPQTLHELLALTGVGDYAAQGDCI